MENTIKDFLSFVRSKTDGNLPFMVDTDNLRMLVAEFTHKVERMLIDRYKLDE